MICKVEPAGHPWYSPNRCFQPLRKTRHLICYLSTAGRGFGASARWFVQASTLRASTGFYWIGNLDDIRVLQVIRYVFMWADLFKSVTRLLVHETSPFVQ